MLSIIGLNSTVLKTEFYKEIQIFKVKYSTFFGIFLKLFCGVMKSSWWAT